MITHSLDDVHEGGLFWGCAHCICISEVAVCSSPGSSRNSVGEGDGEGYLGRYRRADERLTVGLWLTGNLRLRV